MMWTKTTTRTSSRGWERGNDDCGVPDDMRKLQQGEKLPSITLKLIGGDTLTLPDDMPSRYLALLFYRAHW